jgi:hypothetical protein
VPLLQTDIDIDIDLDIDIHIHIHIYIYIAGGGQTWGLDRRPSTVDRRRSTVEGRGRCQGRGWGARRSPLKQNTQAQNKQITINNHTQSRALDLITGGSVGVYYLGFWPLKRGTLCGIEKLIFYIRTVSQNVTVWNWVWHGLLGVGQGAGAGAGASTVERRPSTVERRPSIVDRRGAEPRPGPEPGRPSIVDR